MYPTSGLTIPAARSDRPQGVCLMSGLVLLCSRSWEETNVVYSDVWNMLNTMEYSSLGQTFFFLRKATFPGSALLQIPLCKRKSCKNKLSWQ